MSPEEKSLIKDLEKCDFSEIHTMHKANVEARKSMSKEEKQVTLFLFSLVLIPGIQNGKAPSERIFVVGSERSQPEDH